MEIKNYYEFIFFIYKLTQRFNLKKMKITSFFYLIVIFSFIIVSKEKSVGECAQDFSKESMSCPKVRDLIKIMKCVIKCEERYISCLEKAPDYPKTG